MLSTNPYLIFNGTAESAMNFYRSVFGGEFTGFQRYKDIPGGEKMKPDDQQKMLHVTLTTDKGVAFMASDSVDSKGDDLTFGNNHHICIQAESEQEVDKIYEGLVKDGKSEMPPNKTFWGAYFAMCTDKFGFKWMINYSEIK
ncbi:MAG TPA: VOC family protein [Chitinophagaceae bacterium]